jgi:hypothetical protein
VDLNGLDIISSLMLVGQTIGENVANPSFDEDAMVEAINGAPRKELEQLWKDGDGLV